MLENFEAFRRFLLESVIVILMLAVTKVKTVNKIAIETNEMQKGIGLLRSKAISVAQSYVLQ